jgi:ATP-dependent Lon protease
MECRRRVKEQQRRIGSAEFRNTHFSYTIGEGVEQFVSTPELQSPDEIGGDPLPPGQVWAISPGGEGENPGLFRVDVTVGPGSGVKILNAPAPAPFRESVRVAEQNLLARAMELVGDREPRQHEFNVQLRSMDAAKSGSSVGLPVLLALASGLLERSLKGGLIIVGGLNLGGGIETLPNAVSIAEVAVEKGATAILVPISARRQLNDLSDDMATKVSILYYSDAREALIKALGE